MYAKINHSQTYPCLTDLQSDAAVSVAMTHDSHTNRYEGNVFEQSTLDESNFSFSKKGLGKQNSLTANGLQLFTDINFFHENFSTDILNESNEGSVENGTPSIGNSQQTEGTPIISRPDYKENRSQLDSASLEYLNATSIDSGLDVVSGKPISITTVLPPDEKYIDKQHQSLQPVICNNFTNSHVDTPGSAMICNQVTGPTDGERDENDHREWFKECILFNRMSQDSASKIKAIDGDSHSENNVPWFAISKSKFANTPQSTSNLGTPLKKYSDNFTSKELKRNSSLPSFSSIEGTPYIPVYDSEKEMCSKKEHPSPKDPIVLDHFSSISPSVTYPSRLDSSSMKFTSNANLVKIASVSLHNIALDESQDQKPAVRTKFSHYKGSLSSSSSIDCKGVLRNATSFNSMKFSVKNEIINERIKTLSNFSKSWVTFSTSTEDSAKIGQKKHPEKQESVVIEKEVLQNNISRVDYSEENDNSLSGNYNLFGALEMKPFHSETSTISKTESKADTNIAETFFDNFQLLSPSPDRLNNAKFLPGKLEFFEERNGIGFGHVTRPETINTELCNFREKLCVSNIDLEKTVVTKRSDLRAVDLPTPSNELQVVVNRKKATNEGSASAEYIENLGVYVTPYSPTNSVDGGDGSRVEKLLTHTQKNKSYVKSKYLELNSEKDQANYSIEPNAIHATRLENSHSHVSEESLEDIRIVKSRSEPDIPDNMDMNYCVSPCQSEPLQCNESMNIMKLNEETDIGKTRSADATPRNICSQWSAGQIEDYLFKNNFEDHLRLGFLSSEDIEIYEWKRATGNFNVGSNR